MAITDSGREVGRGFPSLAGLSALMRRGSLHMAVKAYMICILVPFSFPLGPLNMTGARVILLVLFVPMMFRLLTGKSGRIYPIDIFLILHFMWIGVTLAINNPQMVIENTGSTGLEFLGGYMLGRSFVRTKEDMIGLFRFAVLLVLCSLPLAIYEANTGVSLMRNIITSIPGLGANPKTLSPQRMGLERVQMGYLTPIHYGIFCTLAFSFCFVGLRGVYGGFRRVISTIGVGICTFLSLSSGALLPMLLQMFLISWGWVFRNYKKRWFILMWFFVAIYVFIDLASNRSPSRVFMSYATFSVSTAYWRAGIAEYGMQSVWAHPIFGIGFADWVRPFWMVTSSVDNYWLLMAMRHGIPGFLTVALGYAWALWRIMRKDLGQDQILLNLRLAWVFAFSVMAFTLITVHIWAEVYSYTFFLLGSGMWLLSVTPSQQGDAPVSVPGGRRGAPERRTLASAPAVERPTLKFSRGAAPVEQRADPGLNKSAADPRAEANNSRADKPRYTRFDHTTRDPE